MYIGRSVPEKEVKRMNNSIMLSMLVVRIYLKDPGGYLKLKIYLLLLVYISALIILASFALLNTCSFHLFTVYVYGSCFPSTGQSQNTPFSSFFPIDCLCILLLSEDINEDN